MSVVRGKIIPLKDKVLVADMHFDEEKTAAGIIIPGQDGKSEGIKPRWARVWAIGPEQTDVKVGEWILLEHGRWSRGIKVQEDNGDEVIIRLADNRAILMVTDEKPNHYIHSQHVTSQHQTFNF